MGEILENITLPDIITIIIIVCLIVFLAKKAIGLALGVLAILILFQIGFMFTGDDVKDKLHLDNFLSPEVVTSVEGFFNDFAERRKEDETINPEEVYDKMIDVTNDAIDAVKNVLTGENIEKFSDGISEALKDAGVKDITMEELCQIIADKFKTTVDDPAVQDMATKIVEELKGES